MSMKKSTREKLQLIGGQALLGIGLLSLVLFALRHSVFHQHMHAPAETCTRSGKTYTMSIKNNAFAPQTVTLKRCDTLVFVNQDTTYHQPALGDHAAHMLYSGFQEKPLLPGKENSFVAATTGTLLVHDHLHEWLRGTLIVQ